MKTLKIPRKRKKKRKRRKIIIRMIVRKKNQCHSKKNRFFSPLFHCKYKRMNWQRKSKWNYEGNSLKQEFSKISYKSRKI